MEEKWLKKLHTAGRLKELRMQGITKRWVINILGVIALFFVIVFVVSAFTIRAYYYNAVESILNSGASTTATNYFSGRLDSGSSLEASAADFIDSFSYRDKTTIWIINNAGGVVTSSSGFAVEKVRMPDYEEALVADTGRARYVGHITEDGEKCMAVTRIIYSGDGEPMGALYSNLFFIRSIIIPVQEINQTTKKISQGDYTVRIEKKYNDEIGDLADSINQMAEDISATDKMKNDFISTISHELRTPLTSIKGWGETLAFAENDNEDEITRKGLQVIVHEAGRLEGFVEELLDFSRLQSGRMKLRLAPTDIFAELDETVFTFRERAMREGIELKYSIPDLPAPANADANRLKQVFMNILDNALKYSRAPAKIFVKAEFAKKGGQDYVKIAVADQGCGISKENLPHVKEKFYKANMSVRGSGIGLAVTNELVELHGGTLEIDSEEGTGTLVTIYLPINSAPSKKDLAQQPQTAETREVDQSMELRGNNANAGEKNA